MTCICDSGCYKYRALYAPSSPESVSPPCPGMVFRIRRAAHNIRRVQRLFSLFPGGRPGVAILLLRIALAAALFDSALMRPDYWLPPWVLPACATIAIFICLGLLTPLAAAAGLLLAFTPWITDAGRMEAAHLYAMVDAIVLFLLGPGGYSLDARLFGRHEVVLPQPMRSDDR